MFSNVLRLSFPGKLFVDQGSDCGPVCVSFICGSLSLSLAVCLCVCLQDYSALVMGFTKRRRQLQSCIFELLNIMLQIVSQKEL